MYGIRSWNQITLLHVRRAAVRTGHKCHDHSAVSRRHVPVEVEEEGQQVVMKLSFLWLMSVRKISVASSRYVLFITLTLACARTC